MCKTTSPRPRSQRQGRKNNTERIRELVALLGSFSKVGDSVSVEVIAHRLGMDVSEASALMDIVCQASGENTSALLISSNEDETEYRLQYPGVTGKPLRLTEAESIAVIHALDATGLPEDDPVRARLAATLMSPAVAEDEVRRALGGPAPAQTALFACVRAQTENKVLTFDYKGLKDDSPRKRRVRILRPYTSGDVWYVRALDLDLKQERTFRIDRIDNAILLDDQSEDALPPSPYASDAHTARMVRITFSERTYYHAFDWPGLQIVRDTGTQLEGVIPYYGEHSTWLVRRICAGNGSITVDDKCIMDTAKSYAAALL